MKLFAIFILVLFATSAFGQTRKWHKRVLIFLDGKRISYKELKAMDTARFSILTVSTDKQIPEVFRKRSITGVSHLKSDEFIENQKRLIQELRREFETNGVETRKLKINGVNYERDEELEEKFLGLQANDIEWIVVRRDGAMKVIQTNVRFELVSRK